MRCWPGSRTAPTSPPSSTSSRRPTSSTPARSTRTSARSSTPRWASSRASTSAPARPRAARRRGPSGGGVRQMFYSGAVEYYEDHAGPRRTRAPRPPRSRCSGRTPRAPRSPSTASTTTRCALRHGRHDHHAGELRLDDRGDELRRRTRASASTASATVNLGGYYDGDRQSVQGAVELHRRAHAAVRAELHAQPHRPAGTADLHEQRPQHARQPLVLAEPLPQGLRAVQRRSPHRQLQLPGVVHLQARQRPLRRLQPGLGREPAGAAAVQRAEPLARGEDDLLAGGSGNRQPADGRGASSCDADRVGPKSAESHPDPRRIRRPRGAARTQTRDRSSRPQPPLKPQA